MALAHVADLENVPETAPILTTQRVEIHAKAGDKLKQG